uniref:Lipocalin n=1 Tax=Rhipicephalus appendiculatus TaxID=34631 RepID=A0A131Z144_RHIAP
MKKSGIFSTIISAILVVSVWPCGTQTRKVQPDIKKFLTPGEIVWVLVTSAERGPDCQVDIIDTIVAGKVYFRRLIGYKFTMSDFQQFLEGHLQSSRKFRRNVSDVLNVGYRGAAPTSEEKLLYLSQQYNCGVFEVKGLPNDTCGASWHTTAHDIFVTPDVIQSLNQRRTMKIEY